MEPRTPRERVGVATLIPTGMLPVFSHLLMYRHLIPVLSVLHLSAAVEQKKRLQCPAELPRDYSVVTAAKALSVFWIAQAVDSNTAERRMR